MPKYKVIKAHDGVQAGTIKTLPASSITRYMVDNGFWEEVADELVKTTAVKRNTSKRTTTKK